MRLVFSFLLFLLFAGVLALRAFVDDPARRGAWTAIATIVAFVDVPLVYFCVRWWRTLHQMQSTPGDDVGRIKLPMRINAFAILFLACWFIARRAELERRRQAVDEAPEPARIPVAGRRVETERSWRWQPEGVIIGGWNFVVAAYAVTAVVLAAYAWSLRSRLAKLQRRTDSRRATNASHTDG